MPVQTPRSYLYVPGDAPAKLAKALGRGADALIVDLEDAVPAAAKAAARVTVRDWLAEVHGAGLLADDAAPQIWVRVNPGADGVEDVRAVASKALTGVMLAKTEARQDVVDIDAALTEEELRLGVAPGSIGVVPLLESAVAVLRAVDIATAPRVVRLQVGEADLAADMGLEVGPDGAELAHVRAQVVLVSVAAGIAPPVAPVATDFRDLEALRSSTVALARRGYLGRACIHPAQVAVANEVFTPSADQLAAAEDVVSRFDRAMAAGLGVVLDADGRMVDEAVVRQARRVLERGRR